MNVDEMTAHLRAAQPSGGIRYARKIDADGKIAARQLILDLFHPDKWNRGLHLITMPSAQWHFERKLLGLREDGWTRYRNPTRTFFTSCENDRAVYFAAIAQMPGVYNQNGLLQKIRPYPFAEYGFKTRYGSLFFANVDDFMAFDWKADAKWDAMWLDYIGPMTVERLQLIRKFYQKHIEHLLILTTLKGRWNHATSRAVKDAGSYSVWLYDNLPGELVHNVEYYDTSPMSQFAIRKLHNLGQQTVDAHGRGAEIAAAGQKSLDAHSSHACGGTNSESLGHVFVDAHISNAEIAAAGQGAVDAQLDGAGGGTLSEHLGQELFDAQATRAEIAAAGHSLIDAHKTRAGGGTPSTTQEKPMVNSSLKDALRSAGFDSAARELKAEAERFLQKNGTPERSIVGFLNVVRKDNDLLQAMALSYLRSVAAKMPLSAPESPENAARTWPAPKPRSEADKIASRGAMRAVTIDLRQQVMIDGQPIGKLSWHDLRHIGRERVLKAAELIGAGQQEIIKARLIALMVEHAQVTDENATVNDVISSELFAKLHKRAVKETPSITAAIIPEVARVSSQIIERISRPTAS